MSAVTGVEPVVGPVSIRHRSHVGIDQRDASGALNDLIKITKVGRGMIRVSDQDEAIEFYTTSAALPRSTTSSSMTISPFQFPALVSAGHDQVNARQPPRRSTCAGNALRVQVLHTDRPAG